jgi:hypothetical protein
MAKKKGKELYLKDITQIGCQIPLVISQLECLEVQILLLQQRSHQLLQDQSSV